MVPILFSLDCTTFFCGQTDFMSPGCWCSVSCRNLVVLSSKGRVMGRSLTTVEVRSDAIWRTSWGLAGYQTLDMFGPALCGSWILRSFEHRSCTPREDEVGTPSWWELVCMSDCKWDWQKSWGFIRGLVGNLECFKRWPKMLVALLSLP